MLERVTGKSPILFFLKEQTSKTLGKIVWQLHLYPYTPTNLPTSRKSPLVSTYPRTHVPLPTSGKLLTYTCIPKQVLEQVLG